MTTADYMLLASSMSERGFMPVVGDNGNDVMHMYHVQDGTPISEIDRLAREVKVIFTMVWSKYPGLEVPKLYWAPVTNEKWRSNAIAVMMEVRLSRSEAEVIVDRRMFDLGVTL